ncbi:hypothetical protein JYT87_00310 [Nitrospira defluvii]|nr:hypothetical protein [Nitrospira defluvii]
MKLNRPSQEGIAPFHLSKMAAYDEKNKGSKVGPKLKTGTKRSNPFGKSPARNQKKFGGALSKIERDAYERGFETGEAAGHTLGMKKIEQTRQILFEMIAEMEELQTKLVQAAEQDILAISLAVAQRILGYEVGSSSKTILKDIQEAIKKIGQSEKIVVHLAPSDLDIMTQETDRLSSLLNEGGALKFEPDDRLSPGECIIDGNERMIDARFDSQIACFADAFKKKGPS